MICAVNVKTLNAVLRNLVSVVGKTAVANKPKQTQVISKFPVLTTGNFFGLGNYNKN